MDSFRWQVVWANRALALRLLGLLRPTDLAQLAQVDKASRVCIRRELKRFRRASARLGLAIWCQHHISLEFQSYFQELETHQIPRSAVGDPRVPPRVVSMWADRGKVPSGVATLRPEALPKRNERGVVLRFAPATADQTPMLTNVVQNQRRIYTVVTLKIIRNLQRATTEQEQENEIVLRRLWYLKEFGEWRAMVPAAAKRRFDDNSALCRFDLVSLDGSVALKLDVPRGADAMMDYFLVQRAVVVLPMAELMYPFVQKLRPTRPLPAAAAVGTESPVQRCLFVLSFGRLDGTIEATHRLVAELTVEQQARATSESSTSNSAPDARNESEAAPRRRTGIESFDIVTIKKPQESSPIHIKVPLAPGYLWLSLIEDQSAANPSPFYYSAAMLHDGATRSHTMLTIDAQWVPGTLAFSLTPQLRQRRPLKGFFHLSVDMDTYDVRELSIVAQHLPLARLEPYDAVVESYTRP